jgi:hypothetical protein
VGQRLVEIYFPRDKIDIHIDRELLGQVDTKEQLEVIRSIVKQYLVVLQG